MLMPSTKVEAKALGAQRYFTGKPCKQGHVTFRNRMGNCVECERLRSCERRLSEPETAKAKDKKWRAENREKHYAQTQRWRENNRDAIASLRREQRAKNRDAANAQAREWRANNLARRRDQQRFAEAKRRAFKNCATGNLTANDVAEITTLQKGKCAACGQKKKLTIDHIVALSNGGAHSRSNIQMLCGPCNSSKRALDPLVFARRTGRLL